jgi:phosphinothricin acetyltransferase
MRCGTGQDEMARRHEALAAGGFPYLVADCSGAVAGYAYAGPYRARPAYRWTVEDSIYVGPDCWRRGIGRALPDRLILEAEIPTSRGRSRCMPQRASG